MSKKIAVVILAPVICLGAFFCIPRPPYGFNGRATTLDRSADIFPDYAGITIPPNIAPLNFRIREAAAAYRVAVHGAPSDSLVVYSRKPLIRFPLRKWRDLLRRCAGKSLSIDICFRTGDEWMRFMPVVNSVARETIDGYLAYRLLNPAYYSWGEMGIFQRNVETFSETAILTNKATNHNCINCHSFCKNNPAMMMLHSREKLAGTLICRENAVTKINARVPGLPGGLAYPFWHPSGRFIAFSVNVVSQVFPSSPSWYVEVEDSASSLVVYDCDKNTVHTHAAAPTGALENMPDWSPDGKYLYYCRAQPRTKDDFIDPTTGTLCYRQAGGSVVRDSDDYYMTGKPDRLVQSYMNVRYDLMRVSFDIESNRYGAPEPVLRASQTGKSIAWPRVSPDGRYLMFVMSSFGYFTIHHHDADLYCLDLTSGRYWPLDSANSPDVESFHSWSSNGRWFVFSSKRIDGIRARPYICYFDSLGQAHKPFILPQKDPDFYSTFLKTYNLPELITGKVRFSERKLREALGGPGKNVETE